MINTKVKPDHVTKIFMEQPEIFADAVNYAVYGGKQVVNPKTLESAPTVATSFAYNGEDAKISFEKLRDVRKVVRLNPEDRTAYMIYGAENQTNIHYAMPVKTMLYDVMEYAGQIEMRGKTFRKTKDITLPEGERKPDTDEFLSSWKKDDRLIPVITIVINFSDKKWDAPTSLHEMFEMNPPERKAAIKAMIPDYRIQVIDPHQMDDSDYRKMTTELGTVMKFIAGAGKKENLEAIDRNSTLSRSSVEVINACTGSKISVPEKGKVIKVSDGIRELMEEGRQRGLEEGLAKGREEGREEGLAEGREEIMDALRKKGIPEELLKEAMESLKNS